MATNFVERSSNKQSEQFGNKFFFKRSSNKHYEHFSNKFFEKRSSNIYYESFGNRFLEKKKNNFEYKRKFYLLFWRIKLVKVPAISIMNIFSTNFCKRSSNKYKWISQQQKLKVTIRFVWATKKFKLRQKSIPKLEQLKINTKNYSNWKPKQTKTAETKLII